MTAGDGEQEKERLPLVIRHRIVTPAMLGEYLFRDFVLLLAQGGVNDGLEKEGGFGALVGSQQRVAFGFIDQDTQAAVIAQTG